MSYVTLEKLEKKRNDLMDVIKCSELFNEEPSDFIKGVYGELETIIYEISRLKDDLKDDLDRWHEHVATREESTNDQ